jgi:hypothetical protein
MIELMEGMPPYVVAARGSGTITKQEYDVTLVPAFERASKTAEGIHFLFLLDTAITHISAGAWWDDVKAGLKHFTKWKKIAIVTDSTGVEKFSDFFTVLTPGQSKGFKKSQLEEAKAWIAQL